MADSMPARRITAAYGEKARLSATHQIRKTIPFTTVTDAILQDETTDTCHRHRQLWRQLLHRRSRGVPHDMTHPIVDGGLCPIR
jgi:hypothetical protein